jgi:hypothetical protein
MNQSIVIIAQARTAFCDEYFVRMREIKVLTQEILGGLRI